MTRSIMAFLQDERALTTVEYAVAGTLIALAVVAAFRTLAGSVAGKIDELNTTVSST